MARRVGFPPEFLVINPAGWEHPETDIPEVWAPRGRWREGAMHTFCDDYRQEFFWRRPGEGAIVALSAGVCTAPDFSIYGSDPEEWARYQVWRSALVAAYWRTLGVTVLPVVTFRGEPQRFVTPGSMWAVRGPGRTTMHEWDEAFKRFCGESKPGAVVVFGNQPKGKDADYGVPIIGRALVSCKGMTAQKEVA